MRYIVDHDFHIHSQLSLCSGDPKQIPERILEYAKENGLNKICITDHFWDASVDGASDWYSKQDYEHIAKALPLPQSEGIEFLFGCETELDRFLTLGISRENIEKFDFVIIPTTHLHMSGFTIDGEATLAERAEAYVSRFDAVLCMDLPFYKIGIAHLTCPLIASKEWQDHLTVLDMIPDSEFERLFIKAKNVGVGIELNFSPSRYDEADLDRVLRPYRIAKKCGCKFYFGSDAHQEKSLGGCIARANTIVDLLDLEENDKFTF